MPDPVLAVLEEIVAVLEAIYERNAGLAASGAEAQEAQEAVQYLKLDLLRARLELERERRALKQSAITPLVEVMGALTRTP